MTTSNIPVITSDGSATLYNPTSGEHYHSTFGAIQESRHIFIEAGLSLFLKQSHISLFEVGFGTGLNALLSMKLGEEQGVNIHYTAVELYPIFPEESQQLNYPSLLEMDASLFLRMHESPQMQTSLTVHFYLEKIHEPFQELLFEPELFDVVYFDAFSPESQPEMWTEEGFEKLYQAIKPGGVLVTYSCKGLVKRALKSAGFRIEKLPGPPGKREFLRAWKDQL